MTKKAVLLTFPKEKINEHVIYNLGHKFKIITNIKRANISREEGWVLLELVGDNNEIEQGISWLESLGVKVSPPSVEEN